MNKPAFWNNNKRYYDLKSYWRNRFGVNVFKLPIDAGFTCPNRDGRLASGGCIYCDGRGSRLRQQGKLPTVTDQLLKGKAYYGKYRKAKKYIAYFQTFTNTYAPLSHLSALYREALAVEEVIGLSIGTRPDCLSPEVIDLLSDLSGAYHIWLELGLQSVHDKTLRLINRGHSFDCFLKGVERVAQTNINLCVHIILGLPGETEEDMLATARAVASLPIAGIKIHLLLALSGTNLEGLYHRGQVPLLAKEEYVSLVCDTLEILPPEMVIQRLTADGYQDIYIAPAWGRNKLEVLNAIDREMERRESYQGSRYQGRKEAFRDRHN